MDSDDLVLGMEDGDRVGEVEMNKVQEQRRVVIPQGFLLTHEMEVGDKVVVKCSEDGIEIKSADDAL